MSSLIVGELRGAWTARAGVLLGFAAMHASILLGLLVWRSGSAAVAAGAGGGCWGSGSCCW